MEKERRTLVKSSDSLQKKDSFTKVKETRKGSQNGGVNESDNDQVRWWLFWKIKQYIFYFQNGPELIIYKEHFLIHNRRPSNNQRKKSEKKLSRTSSFSSILESVGKPVPNLYMSDNFDPDQDKFQTTLNGHKSTVENEKCWWLQSIFTKQVWSHGPSIFQSSIFQSSLISHPIKLWIKKKCLKCLSWFKQTILSPIAADQRTLEINRGKKYTNKFTYPATKGKLSLQYKYMSDKFKLDNTGMIGHKYNLKTYYFLG